ncbi:ureidoglycolate hydrolase [Aspergillus ibericus CBS 121593]|uniref:Ureidoglycolate hydrolase n=1 Tax=Aspergillus ibericus CBS 121593 TaxID=1448316 RepID=A0A395H907_9EURO|nr:ureidoglycolate hydrolase [Aspergillus ibericus CBS 121593]RAL03645.1 ureidoglycolate hydrolase [Aspergillus ibericus CBS 121593]
MAPPTLPSTLTPTLTLTPTPLTPESFSPFGTAITSPLSRDITTPPPASTLSTIATPPPVLANQSTALKYSPISPLLDTYNTSPSGTPSSARMSMFSCFPRKLRPSPQHTNEKNSGATNKTRELFDVHILERHPYTTQTFIPIDLSSQTVAGGAEEPVYLVIVAPSMKGTTAIAKGENGEDVTVRDPPDLNRLRAFVARGNTAVTYAAGTWHAPMVVVGRRRVDFVVVQFVNGVEGEDCQEVVFGEGVVVEVESGVDREGSRGEGERGRLAKL